MPSNPSQLARVSADRPWIPSWLDPKHEPGLCAGGNVSLELLFLQDVMMTGRGAAAVAELLRNMRSLGSLKLGSNVLGVSGLNAICTAVGKSDTLEELYLYDVNHTGILPRPPPATPWRTSYDPCTTPL